MRQPPASPLAEFIAGKRRPHTARYPRPRSRLFMFSRSWRCHTQRTPAGGPTRVFPSDSCAKHHAHGPEAAHCHAPDPGTLGAGFSLKSALLTVAAAGLRPCSGAILVLVFALSQGVGRRNVL